MNAAVEADDAPPHALRQRVRDALAIWHRYLVQLLEQGQQTGEVRPAADPARYATLFIALNEGGILLAQTTGKPAPLETCLTHIEHLIEGEIVV